MNKDVENNSDVLNDSMQNEDDLEQVSGGKFVRVGNSSREAGVKGLKEGTEGIVANRLGRV